MTKSQMANPESQTLQAMRRQLHSHPAVRNYVLWCLAALFLLVVCLSQHGLEWWCLVPALIGCLTLLTYWHHGPPLVLLSLVVLLGMRGPFFRWNYWGWSRFQTPTLMDFALCLAVLAYVVGHYRLLSLVRPLFPLDCRRPRAGSDADLARHRSADLVTPWEMALLGLALPVWTVLAALAWTWLTEEEKLPLDMRPEMWRLGIMEVGELPPLDMRPEMWHVLRIAWMILAAMAATGAVVFYLRRTTATPRESLLYLQDELWRQTRRQQSSLHRWLAWTRQRVQRKREGS